MFYQNSCSFNNFFQKTKYEFNIWCHFSSQVNSSWFKKVLVSVPEKQDWVRRSFLEVHKNDKKLEKKRLYLLAIVSQLIQLFIHVSVWTICSILVSISGKTLLIVYVSHYTLRPAEYLWTERERRRNIWPLYLLKNDFPLTRKTEHNILIRVPPQGPLNLESIQIWFTPELQVC